MLSQNCLFMQASLVPTRRNISCKGEKFTWIIFSMRGSYPLWMSWSWYQICTNQEWFSWLQTALKKKYPNQYVTTTRIHIWIPFQHSSWKCLLITHPYMQIFHKHWLGFQYPNLDPIPDYSVDFVSGFRFGISDPDTSVKWTTLKFKKNPVWFRTTFSNRSDILRFCKYK